MAYSLYMEAEGSRVRRDSKVASRTNMGSWGTFRAQTLSSHFRKQNQNLGENPGKSSQKLPGDSSNTHTLEHCVLHPQNRNTDSEGPVSAHSSRQVMGDFTASLAPNFVLRHGFPMLPRLASNDLPASPARLRAIFKPLLECLLSVSV